MSDFPRWQIQLVVSPRDGAPERRLFRKDELAVGRAATNDVAVRSQSASRAHCRLSVDGEGQVWVDDLGSVNGTWLCADGRLVRCAHDRVAAGDTIYVGDCAVALAAAPERVDDVMARSAEIERLLDVAGPPSARP
jgi:pSer/pThr/pTyr-binding forkhead associated (FHA) protein